MKAIPNQLNNLYDQKGIDSAEFCKKINIVKAVNSYVKQFDFNYFNQYKIYRECYQGFYTMTLAINRLLGLKL